MLRGYNSIIENCQLKKISSHIGVITCYGVIQSKQHYNQNMKVILQTAVFLLIALLANRADAQEMTQTIRGSITDKVSHIPLPGATVMVVGSNPIKGTTTDVNGNFRLAQVPVGNVSLLITYVGYKEQLLSNLVLNSGKELVLQLALEEDFQLIEAVEIKAENDKNKPINEMAMVSARSFSVEETRRYAAAVNDPARMVTAYTGVVQTDDGNNGISIRGNAPNGLLWRMEGIDIPNPNHFANTASSGGGIMILSAQLLSDSDFLTGAFPAEYGNALSGVFDIKLRKGNNERHEYTMQAGLLGIDLAAEGPLNRKNGGSYLVNYRYSTLSILSNLGLDLGANTDFQDLSFHLHMPTAKAGTFSLFGFGGLSSQHDEAEKDSLVWEEDFDRISWNYFSNTAAAGVKHGIVLDNNTFLQSTLTVSANESGYEQFRMNDIYVSQKEYFEKFTNSRVGLNTTISRKITSRIHSKSGLFVTRLNYNMNQTDLEIPGQENVEINADGTTFTTQVFNQWSYKAGAKWTLNGGVHFLHLALNNTWSLEPRASMRYEIDQIQSVSVGYGLHSQIHALPNYFYTETSPGGAVYQPNIDLKMNKSHHFVSSYSRALGENLHAKAEVYYQHLFNLPVSSDPNSTFALVNQEWGFATEPLLNNGIGRNTGLELSLEQFMNRNLYYLFSASLYDSKYKAADGNWYNTRFNGNYVFTFTGGKEWEGRNKSKRITYGVNIKSTWSGGLRTTPIDLEGSRAEGETVYFDQYAFEDKLPDYFRTDLRLSIKRQRAKSTGTLSLDIQNVTNRQNVFNQFYNIDDDEVQTFYQVGIIPVLAYRIEF
jgi:hypothetical protein